MPTTKSKHVLDLWFERVIHQPPKGQSPYIVHVMVVVTDLLSDLEILDGGGHLDDLEDELRKQHDHRGDVRFVPPGRYTKK
jgi:hypothetical protein